jgi:hypothetical protein
MKYNFQSLKPMIPILIMLSLVIFAAESFGAETDFQFGQITTKGSGCPAGTVEVIKTEDQKTASILFSEMMVQVPQFDGDNENDEFDDDNSSPTSRHDQFTANKVCKIVINADIPEGHRIVSADISIDYRGATFMDQGTQALFHSKFLNFTGPQNREHRVKGTVLRKVWRKGDVDEDWNFSQTKTIDLNSNCGVRGQRKTKLTLKNVLKAQVHRNYRHTGASAFLSLDSADIVGKMKIKFKTQPCHGGGNVGGNSGGSDVNPPRQCRRGFSYSPRIGRCMPSRMRPDRPVRPPRRNRR